MMQVNQDSPGNQNLLIGCGAENLKLTLIGALHNEGSNKLSICEA